MNDLTDDDLRARSQALDETQELYEELAYLSNPKMPCPECTGSGAVSGGSLGDLCVRCMGMRVIEHPGSSPMEMPPFAQLRAAIGAYGNVLADLALPADHLAKRHLALPSPATVPTLESLQELRSRGLSRARELAAGAPGIVEGRLLREARPAADDGDLSAVTDAEIDGDES